MTKGLLIIQRPLYCLKILSHPAQKHSHCVYFKHTNPAKAEQPWVFVPQRIPLQFPWGMWKMCREAQLLYWGKKNISYT